MSNIQNEILRLQAARDKIRNKLTGLGLATSTDKLDTLANTVEGIVDNGGVDVEVKEGETYKIPKGYHNGSGTVSGVAGGGNYTLQSKTVTPTKAQQNIVADAGKYGLSSVTVEAIPEAYQDVSSVNATAADVLANKMIVTKDGTLVAGTMPNNGTAHGTLTPSAAVHIIPQGYHSGLGTVGVALEEKTATPTKEEQVLTATTKYINKVTIAPIPDEYQDVTSVTATADKVLVDSVFVDAEGNVVDGTMRNNGATVKTLTPADVNFMIPAGYHNGVGFVGVASEDKSVTPTKEEQVLTATTKYMKKVTIAPIPDEYQDVTEVTATAEDVLKGTYFVDANGVKTEGNIISYDPLHLELSPSLSSPFVSGGYYKGTGMVTVAAEEVDEPVVPSKSTQVLDASKTNKYMSKVTIAAIPDTYQDITVTTAEAAHVLDDKKFVSSTGVVTEGTMANNGDVSASMDGLTVTSVTIPAGYTTGGTISLTDDIEAALAAI